MPYKDPLTQAIYYALYGLLNHERNLARNRSSYRNNKEERRAQGRAYYNSRKADHKEWRRRSWLRIHYGLTPEEFEAKRASQNNSCAICNKPFQELPHIDHDHETKEVRALLCRDCNLLLGNAHDNVETLEKAVAYLKAHGKTTAS